MSFEDIDNPAYGYWNQDDIDDYISRTISPSFGGRESAIQGDGTFCPKCEANGFYNWLDFSHKTVTKEFYSPCPKHKFFYRNRAAVDGR